MLFKMCALGGGMFCPVHEIGAGLYGSKISLRSIGYEPYHSIMKGSTWVHLGTQVPNNQFI